MTDTYNLDHGFATLRQSVLMTWGLKPGQYDRMMAQIDELEADFKRQLKNEELRNS